MLVTFKTGKLEAYYLDSKKAIREFGQDVAKRYIGRINIIKATKNLGELQKLPGLYCASPTGNEGEEGKWTVKLIDFYQLVFTLRGEAIEVAHINQLGKNYDD